jgi:hypothetical protein
LLGGGLHCFLLVRFFGISKTRKYRHIRIPTARYQIGFIRPKSNHNITIYHDRLVLLHSRHIYLMIFAEIIMN